MKIDNAFDKIIDNCHYLNWAPDWVELRKVYNKFPNSYSILTPFAYSYLEELIRSKTSEYGCEYQKRRKVGYGLIELSINENEGTNKKLIDTLEDLKKYFKTSHFTDGGHNRNSVVHGYIHPRYWDKDSFEELICDIAKLSEFSGF